MSRGSPSASAAPSRSRHEANVRLTDSACSGLKARYRARAIPNWRSWMPSASEMRRSRSSVRPSSAARVGTGSQPASPAYQASQVEGEKSPRSIATRRMQPARIPMWEPFSAFRAEPSQPKLARLPRPSLKAARVAATAWSRVTSPSPLVQHVVPGPVHGGQVETLGHADDPGASAGFRRGRPGRRVPPHRARRPRWGGHRAAGSPAVRRRPAGRACSSPGTAAGPCGAARRAAAAACRSGRA